MRVHLRTAAIFCAAGLAFGTATGTAGTATAQSSPAVAVPEHPVDSSLTLIGASSRAVAVQQGVPASDPGDYARIYSGAEGTELVRRPQVEPSLYLHPEVLAVVGGTLGWAVSQAMAGSRNYVVHRMNARTGKDVTDGQMPEPLAFTGSGWLSDRLSSVTQYPFPPPTLKRYQNDGTALTSTDVMADPGTTTALAVDGGSALQASYVNTDLSQVDGAPRYRLDLVDLAHGTAQTLAQALPDPIVSVALSPTTIAWGTQAGGGPLVIHERARAGGPITAYTESDADADAAHLAAGDGSAGYLVQDPRGSQLRVVTGASATTVDLPDGSSGIGAVGDQYLTAADGTGGTGGVFSIGDGTVTRVATVPARTYPLTALALTGSRLYYTDGSVTGSPGTSVWQRPVSGGNRPAFGPEAPVSTHPAGIAQVRSASSISFSAGRGALASHDGYWHLIDRGTQTGLIPDDGDVKVSGPYALSAGKVYDEEGTQLDTEPAVAGETVVHEDLFGSTVVYSLRHDDTGQGEIWMDDVAHPDPVELASTTPASPLCDDAPYVAVWGQTVAWDACDGSGVTLENVVTGSIRSIPATAGRVSTVPFVLGEGTLAWQDDAGTNVVDLTSADLVPAVLPGPAGRLILDDHRIARQLMNAQGGYAGYDVQKLPFPGKNRPRLIGTAAPLGFTPDGDGHADTWTPQFDVTKPLRAATLTISALGTSKALATLVGTAPDGSVRDLSWNGRDKKGTMVPVGTYRWTLTGKAADGDGALIGPDGQSAVQGTIEIDAVG